VCLVLSDGTGREYKILIDRVEAAKLRGDEEIVIDVVPGGHVVRGAYRLDGQRTDRGLRRPGPARVYGCCECRRDITAATRGGARMEVLPEAMRGLVRRRGMDRPWLKRVALSAA
jgi:hypothetical protein